MADLSDCDRWGAISGGNSAKSQEIGQDRQGRQNGGDEAESGAPTIDNAEDALREVYGMMKEAMNTDAEQSFQQAFGPPQERY